MERRASAQGKGLLGVLAARCPAARRFGNLTLLHHPVSQLLESSPLSIKVGDCISQCTGTGVVGG